MANRVWRGDAVAVAQVTRVTPGTITAGREYGLRINSKDITVTAGSTSASALCDLFVTAISATDIPEWSEVTATNSGGVLVLTSRSKGVPFTVTGVVGGFYIGPAIVVTVANNPTGGTWLFDAGDPDDGDNPGYGTANIGYADSEATMQTAMDGLFGAGNTLVTKRAFATYVTYTIEFIGTFVGQAVPAVTVSYASLTGGDAALVATKVQAAVVGTDEVQTVTCYGTPTGGTRGFRFRGQTATVAYDASPATVQTAMRALSTIAGPYVTVTGTANSSYVFTFSGNLGHQALDPIQVISSGLTGGSIYAEVTVTTPGAAGTNQINYVQHRTYADTQAQIQLDQTGTWTAGSWTLTINGDTTSAIAWDATSVEIAVEIETLLGSKGVIVSDLIGGYKQISFYGPLYTMTLSSVSVSSSITGGTVTLSGYSSGSAGGSSSPADMGYHFEIDPGTGTLTTGSIARSASMATIQAAIQAVTGAGTATVTALEGSGSMFSSGDGLYQIEWKAALGGGYVYVTVIQEGGDPVGLVETEIYQQGASTGTNEVQAVTVYGTPTYGTFTLANGTEVTAAIPYNDTSVGLLNKLLNLSSFAAGDLTASGGPLSTAAVSLTYGGAYAYADVPTLIVNDDNLKAKVEITTPGVTGKNEIQKLSLTGQDVWAGTVTMTVAGDTVGAVDFDADVLAVVAELETSVGLTAGDLDESYGGPWPESPIYIVFGGTQAETDCDLITATDALKNGTATAVSYDPLIVDRTTRATGPNYWNEPTNWFNPADASENRCPERGDQVFLSSGSTDILYGLVQRTEFTVDTVNDWIVPEDRSHDLIDGQIVEVWSSGSLPTGLAAATDYYVRDLDGATGKFRLAAASNGAAIDLTTAGTGTMQIGVRLAGLLQLAAYTGKVGLPATSDDGDYHEYRALDLKIGVSGAGTITIGQGEGSGTGRFNLDTGGDQIVLEVINSSGAQDGASVNWIGSSTASVVRVLGGDLGIALRPTETAACSLIEQRGGSLRLGTVAITSFDKTGGQFTQADSLTLSGTQKIRG